MPHVPGTLYLFYDLERDIFRLAARDDVETTIQLTLVSRYVRQWVDPLLYKQVLLTNPAAVERFVYAVSSKRSHFVPFITKTLYLPLDASPRSADEILSLCTNVVNLKCDMIAPQDADSLVFDLEELRPQQISFGCFSSFFNDYLKTPLLEQVTHAHFGDSWDSWRYWDFTEMPKLTHLALTMDVPLHYKPFIDKCKKILRDCPRLEVLVMHDDCWHAVGELFGRLEDPRIVMFEEEDYLYDWDEPFEGKVALWVDAEEEVNKQKAIRLEDQT